MPNDLDAHLQAVRAALLNDCSTVVIRGAFPVEALDIAQEHIVIDVVPGGVTQGMGGAIGEDLVLQIGAWSTTLGAALALAEAARARLASSNYERVAGTAVRRSEPFVGIITTYSQPLAFNSIT